MNLSEYSNKELRAMLSILRNAEDFMTVSYKTHSQIHSQMMLIHDQLDKNLGIDTSRK